MPRTTLSSDLVLRGCSLVDVEAGEVRPLVDIRVSDGLVTTVTASGDRSALEDDVRVVDLDGRFVAPGLIDMHVHSTFHPGDGTRSEPSAVERALLAAQNHATALRAGVTSIRDVGTAAEEAFQLARAWRHGRLAGPRPFVSGPALTAVGGHGNEYGTTIGLEVTGRTEIVRSVRRIAALGADVIKVIVNGPPAPGELSHEEVRAAVEAAHACGLPVAAHAQMDGDVLDRAIDAGADTIEHGLGISEVQIERLAGRRGFLTPTLAAYASIEPNAEFFGGPQSAFVQGALRSIAAYQPMVRAAHEAGVRVLAGTDAGNPSVDFAAVHDELRLLSRNCGLGPLTALRAATLHAADALGRPDLGRVRDGAVGDLLVLDADPLEDLAVLAEPVLVIRSTVGRSTAPAVEITDHAGALLDRRSRTTPATDAAAGR